MSGIAQEFDCKAVRMQESSRSVFMLGIDGEHIVFKYDIDCTADMDVYKIKFYFNTKSQRMLIVNRSSILRNGYTCIHMTFWMSGDLPTPSIQYLLGQDKILTLIYDEFKEKYAAILIDEAINN